MADTWYTYVSSGAFSCTAAFSLSGWNTGSLSFSSSTFTMTFVWSDRWGCPQSLAFTTKVYFVSFSLSSFFFRLICPECWLITKAPPLSPLTISYITSPFLPSSKSFAATVSKLGTSLFSETEAVYKGFSNLGELSLRSSKTTVIRVTVDCCGMPRS